MPLSSIAYSTELTPDRRLRRLVLGSGVCLLLLGLIVIAAMSISAVARLGLAIAWTLLAAHQLRGLARYYAGARKIVVHADGSATVGVGDHTWHAATILPGSIVLDRVAWLRIGIDGAPTGGELLAGNARENKEWRRLQVIWRHLGKPE